MKLIRNSLNNLVAIVDSEDIVDIHNYSTSTNTTTLTIPAINNKDINFVNYGLVAWTLAPDLNEGLTINKSTSGITVNAGKSVSLRYDTLAKNFIIAGSSESSGGGGSQTLADTLALGNDANNLKITNLATPTVNSDATNKLYVDTGLNGKQNTLTAGTNITIDNTNPLAPIINASGGGGSFNPTTDTIGDITATNSAILDNDTVTVALGKTQGQINNRRLLPSDEGIATSGTVNLDFSIESFDSKTQTGSITFTGTNTTGSKYIKKTLDIQGSGNIAHTFSFPVGWINVNGILPDYSKRNLITFEYVDGTVFFCVYKYNTTDTTGPVLLDVRVLYSTPNVIELVYNEQLTVNSLAAGNFTLPAGIVTSTGYIGNIVRLQTSNTYTILSSYTVTYTVPVSNKIEDINGNAALGFTNYVGTVFSLLDADTFSRADNASSAGVTEIVGTSYTPFSGTWGILSNKLYIPSALSTGATVTNIVQLDLGKRDVFFKVDIDNSGAITTGNFGVIFSGDSSAENHYLFTMSKVGSTITPQLYKKISNTYTLINSYTTFSSLSTNTVVVEVNGSTLRVIVNGATILNIVDTSISTGNYIGIRVLSGSSFGSAVGDRFDNLEIYE